MSAAAGCPSAGGFGFGWTDVVLLVAVWIPCALLVLIASSYPSTAPPRRQRLGMTLRRLGGITAIGSIVLVLAARAADAAHGRCSGSGYYQGWLEIAGLAGVAGYVVGVALDTSAEWLVIALLVDVDVAFAVAGVENGGRHTVTVALLFGVHGAYTAVAAWWSWRLRGAPAVHRAAASEAGRVLASGWVVISLLATAASHDSAAGKNLFTDSQLVTVLIITATSIAVGAGYTKYVQARDAHPEPAPRITGPLAVLGASIGQLGWAVGDWHRAYKEFF